MIVSCSIICCTIILCVFYICNKVSGIFNQAKYNYKDILELFDYFLSKSYDTIYEMDLITHITNNVTLNPDERETYERNFIKRTMIYMGKRNLKLFINFFGDKETVIINMIRYMRKRINDDGLTKIIQQQNQQEQLQQ